jgi:hypothetical protein
VVLRGRGCAQLAHERKNVAAKAALVGSGVPRLEYSSVHAAAHMLDEGAEQPAIRGADLKIAVQYDFSLQHEELFHG